MFRKLLHHSFGQGKRRIWRKTGALLVICSLLWMMQAQLPVSRADASQNFTAGTQINGSIPTVTGVSPSKGAMAGGTTVTGATAVHFGSGSATGAKVNGSTISGGQVTHKPPVTPSPTVTAVSPNSGSTAGGTTVTITGTNLTGATAVKFGATAAASYTVASDTSVTATSPAESAGAVDVTVYTAGGTSATSAADQFTYVAPVTLSPTVTAVSPNSGSTAGGTAVTITGTNLTGATAVKFGSRRGNRGHGQQQHVDHRHLPGRNRHGGRDRDHCGRHQRHQLRRPVHLRSAGHSSPTVTAVSPNSGSTAGGTR